MMKLWKRSILVSAGLAVMAYEEIKKTADRAMKQARQVAQRAG